MMIKFCGFIVLFFLFISCSNQNIEKEIIGKWNYVSYEYKNKSLDKPLASISLQKPSIVFNEKGKLTIYSSGKVLTSGNYIMDGKIIRYEEDLPNGVKRKIPFLIIDLSNDKLVFQTMDAEVKIITAKRE